MRYKITSITLLLFSFSCNNNANSKNKETTHPSIVVKKDIHENEYAQIKNIPLPEGFARLKNDENSFAAWLENISLKKDKTVYTFNGSPKYNQSAQFAVLDISVGKKDLQQCADAVMRLRAEYLFAQNKMNEIVFTDNEGGIYKFTEPFTKMHFAQFMDKVFGMCGSASLAKQLKTKVNFEDIEAGDVIIRGGFPGHAVMVMDIAENAAGKRVYMIAQSYMPAQDIHVLQNPMNENLSPWYEVNEDNIIQTPEYTFRKTELKTW
jgi:Domain of unknown function (4846)